MTAVLGTTTHTARKAHRCTWCGEVIDAGSTYRRSAVIHDGAFQVNKFHPECDDDCLTAAREEGGYIEFMPYENPRPARA